MPRRSSAAVRSSKSSKSSKSVAPPAARRGLVAEDLLRLITVADPQISRDGERLVFVRKSIDERRAVAASIWSVATEGTNEPLQLTAGPKDAMPRLAPDGRRLAFVRTGPGKDQQIAILSFEGGDARPLTRLPEGSIRLMKWSPTGAHLAIAFRATPEPWTERAKRARESSGASEPPRVLDTRWNRLDGDGWFGDARHELVLVDAATGEHASIYTADTLGHFDFDWSPDGTRLALTTNRDPQALLRPWKDEVLLLDVARRSLHPVAGLPIGPKSALAWSPDGRRLAWAGRTGRDGVYSTENLELWTCAVPVAPGKRPPPHSEPRSLTHRADVCLAAATLSDGADSAFDAVIRWAADGESIRTRIGWHGEGHLVDVPLDGGPPVFLTEGPYEHVVGNTSADGLRIAAIRTDALTPAEVGVLVVSRRRAQWRARTAFNAPLCAELLLATPREQWVEAEDGHRTHLWILEPPEVAPTGGRAARRQRTRRPRARPAIIEVHGGPHAQYGVAFFHELQLLAASGYVVAYSNPRGSKGYGRDHCAAIRGHWGRYDWQDIQAVTRYLQSRRDVDANRIGIMGGSYGGYMTNWAIGHSKDYRAAITDRCVANLLSFAGNSDYPIVPGEYWPGTNFDRPEELWRASPIAHFKGVTTPTLIIHSEGDFRCNIEQAEQVHTALVLQGVPTRFVRYPMSTSHGMSRSGPPDLRLHRLEEILAWWRRWL